MQVIDYRAAVDWNDGRIHVGTGTRTQKYRKSGYVLRFANPTRETVACELVAKVFEDSCSHLAVKEAGGDRVNGNVARTQLYRQVTG